MFAPDPIDEYMPRWPMLAAFGLGVVLYALGKLLRDD